MLFDSSSPFHRLVKVLVRLAVEGAHTSSNTLPVAGEAEHGQWYRDRNVASDLACLNVLLEPRSLAARVGENGHAVAVFVAVDQVRGLFKGSGLQHEKHQAEDRR